MQNLHFDQKSQVTTFPSPLHMFTTYALHMFEPRKVRREQNTKVFNPLTSVSHWSGFKVKLTFHEIQFFGSSLYTRQILGILCLQIDLFLIVECIWYNLGHV